MNELGQGDSTAEPQGAPGALPVDPTARAWDALASLFGCSFAEINLEDE